MQNDQELKTDVVNILLLFHEPADEGLIMTKKVAWWFVQVKVYEKRNTLNVWQYNRGHMSYEKSWMFNIWKK